ncbi:MAG: HEPN domain-containing protein, partial [Spirochaetaceae bacterium]|nr:HEPN domain-containing protein [Spirochaetaceae bacterium]
AFHCQQATEKLFKAVLEYSDYRIPKTHNLIVLMELVNNCIYIKIDESFIDQLNELYIESRYPTDLGLLPSGKPSLQEAEDFYFFTRALYKTIKEIVS